MKPTSRLTLNTFAAACLAVACMQAQAQKMSPGLWENTVTMKSADGQMEAAMAKMQAELAKMSPEQRKKMTEMMGNSGVAITPSGGTAIRMCVSKEQAEKLEPPEQADGKCKRESFERTANSIKFKVSCTNPPSTGTGEFTYSSDKAYTGKMVLESQAQGSTRRMEMAQQGKWISADCGTLKPVGK